MKTEGSFSVSKFFSRKGSKREDIKLEDQPLVSNLREQLKPNDDEVVPPDPVKLQDDSEVAFQIHLERVLLRIQVHNLCLRFVITMKQAIPFI